MLNYISFPSVVEGHKIGYELHREWGKYWDFTRRAGSMFYVDSRAGMFETYGDGNVKHSPDVPVPSTKLGDYCLSLAKYVIDLPDSRKNDVGELLVHCFRSEFGEYPKWRQLIPFLAGLTYDEKKPYRYFSLDSDSFCKTSSSESKRHDKRWQAIPSNADGSAEFIWNQLTGYDTTATDGALRGYVARAHFHELCRELNIWVSTQAEEYIKSDEKFIPSAVAILRHVVTSFTAMAYAKSALPNVIDQLEYSKRQVATA